MDLRVQRIIRSLDTDSKQENFGLKFRSFTNLDKHPSRSPQNLLLRKTVEAEWHQATADVSFDAGTGEETISLIRKEIYNCSPIFNLA